MRKILCSITCMLLLQGCSSVSVDRYENFLPALIPEHFFSGRLTAHGVVKNRAGLVIRTFNAEIKADWKDGKGTLVEDFIFNDGEEQQRIWTLTPQGGGLYTGTAGDVVGKGQMESSGNSLFLEYVLRISYGDSTVDVRVDDRMYLVAPDVLINESNLSKFGIEVGSIDLVIIRHDNRDQVHTEVI